MRPSKNTPHNPRGCGYNPVAERNDIMNVMDAVKSRRSIRKFSAKPVEEEKLAAVLEVARLAPSARNMQSWKFIAVDDKKTISKLKAACGNQDQVGMAPVVIAVCATKQNIMTCGQTAEFIDASIAMSYMTLEACEQELGTCWIGNFHEDKVKEILSVPDDATVIAVSPLGYPDEHPAARPRKSASEVISFNKF